MEEDWEALVRSLRRGDDQWKSLLANKGDVNQRHGNGGAALIHAAAAMKSSAVESVLEAKGDPNLQDAFHRTPLIHAACSAPTALIPLIAANADVNHKSQDGATALLSLMERPLDASEEPTVTICLRKLIAAKADVNCRSPLGYCPLFFAATNHPQCVAILLQAGANPLLRTKYGDTAREEAVRQGYDQAAEQLFVAESDPKHFGDKFRGFGYVVLMLSALNLPCKAVLPCKELKGAERAPKYQPYLLVRQRGQTLQKVHAVSGDSVHPFFDRVDLHCKDYDLSEPIEFQVVANGTMRTEVYGTFSLVLGQFQYQEKLDDTELPLLTKKSGGASPAKVRIHASRVRFVHEPFEKTPGT